MSVVLKKGELIGMTVLDITERTDIRVAPDGKMRKVKIVKLSNPKSMDKGGA